MKCGKGPLKGKQLEIVVTDHDGGMVVKMMVVLMRKKKGSPNDDLLFATTLPPLFASPVCLRSRYVRPFSFHLRNKARKTVGRKERKASVLYVFRAAAPKTGR